jgi:diphosphomevalonate decarboxylase
MKKNKIHWSSPSNIAIVKYWGKYESQIPMNPSISFTLSECRTETSVEWSHQTEKNHCSFEFYYEGKLKPEFDVKIKKYLDLMVRQIPVLKNLHLIIHSKNTFPHSAGIASSASAMSALALCLVSIEQEMLQHTLSEEDFLRKASHWARLGSGSAARSLFSKAAVWGAMKGHDDYSNEWAIPFGDKLHPMFHRMQDCIFIVSKSEKSVSSTAGHQLMEHHPYRQSRIEQANNNMTQVMTALINGNWREFAGICEEEALTLHGLMMSSRPGYILLEPESLHVISEIKKFANDSGLPLTFTIDAGPNIHMLYPEEIKKEIHHWLQKQFPEYWNEHKFIFDHTGAGPVLMHS